MAATTEKKLFQKGGPGGPGRRPGPQTNYRAIFEQCVSAQAFFNIINKAVDDAVNGTNPQTRQRARAWVVSHLLSPLPKTLKIENTDEPATDSRKMLDALIELVPPEQLQGVLSSMEQAKQ